MQKYNWNYPTTMWVGENRINDIAIACESLGITKEDYFVRPPNMSIELDCEKYGPVPTEEAENATMADPNNPNAAPTDPSSMPEEEEEFDYNDQFDVE